MQGDVTSQRRWEAYDKLGTFAIYVIGTILVIQVGGLAWGVHLCVCNKHKDLQPGLAQRLAVWAAVLFCPATRSRILCQVGSWVVATQLNWPASALSMHSKQHQVGVQLKPCAGGMEPDTGKALLGCVMSTCNRLVRHAPLVLGGLCLCICCWCCCWCCRHWAWRCAACWPLEVLEVWPLVWLVGRSARTCSTAFCS